MEQYGELAMRLEGSKERALAYMQPKPVKHWIAAKIMQSELQASWVCMDGSRKRSEVWPMTK